MSDGLGTGEPPASRRRRGRRRTANAQSQNPASVITQDIRLHPETVQNVDDDNVEELAEDLASLATLASQSDNIPDQPQLVASFFAGPLPPPSDLATYENIVPGLAGRIVEHYERFLTLMEEEAQDRRERQGEIQRADIALRTRGQIFAFVIVLFAFSLVGLGIINHNETFATVFGLPSLILLLAVFFGGVICARRVVFGRQMPWQNCCAHIFLDLMNR